MMHLSFPTAPAARGRPRAVLLTEAEQLSLGAWMLRANKGADSISVSMAARTWAQRHHPELAALLAARASKHSLPECVLEVARRVLPMVPLHRDARKVRDVGGLRGFLRLREDGSRLRAGERFSFDDATPNFGVCVPWPQGGDKCSDRFGVRLGRFQLLVAHDDATSFVPCYLHQVRPTGAYRGEDAVTLPLRLCRDVALPAEMVLEGGVWQGPRMTSLLSALGVRIIDAKGRPNQKLVENYFNRLWTRLALAMGRADVGRARQDDVEGTKPYLEARAGRLDPRRVFPMLSEVLEHLDECIQWLNNDRIESGEYGKWIPAERWAADLEETPRLTVPADQLPHWTTAPVLRTVTVQRAQARTTAEDGWGGRSPFTFAAPELVQLERRRVRLAFDPLNLAAGGWIVEADRPRVLCQATCVTAAPGVDFGEAWGRTKRVREAMRRDYRVLTAAGGTARRETETRVVIPEGRPTPAETRLSRSGLGQAAGSGEDGGRAAPDHEPQRNRGGDVFAGLLKRASRNQNQSTSAAHTGG